MEEGADLSRIFEQNLLAETDSWFKHVLDEKELEGLSEHAKKAARSEAISRDLEGYVLTLQAPCYIAVMQEVDNQDIRKEMYEAYVTRASEYGQNPSEYNNDQIMVNIVQKRQEKANILGFSNYAEYALQTYGKFT